VSQYLISTYLPDDFGPPLVKEATVEAIHALNREMIAAGVRKFACGLSPKAVTLRSQPDGEVVVIDGPYLEPKEYVVAFRYWKPIASTRLWRGRAWAPRPSPG
jgi:hypothetical protein